MNVGRHSNRQTVSQNKHVLTGEKPFACDQCGKAFAYVSALTRHKHIDIDLMGVGIAEKMPGMESICCRSLTSLPLGVISISIATVTRGPWFKPNLLHLFLFLLLMMDTDAAASIWKSTSHPATDSFIAEGFEFFPPL